MLFTFFTMLQAMKVMQAWHKKSRVKVKSLLFSYYLQEVEFRGQSNCIKHFRIASFSVLKQQTRSELNGVREDFSQLADI